jgi:hypothetical protein
VQLAAPNAIARVDATATTACSSINIATPNGYATVNATGVATCPQVSFTPAQGLASAGAGALSSLRPITVTPVAGSGSILYLISTEDILKLFKIYKLHGLSSDPLVVSPTGRQAGSLVQAVTGTDIVTVSTLEEPSFTDANVSVMLSELAMLHGIGADLTVSNNTRSAGSITQTINTVGNVTTVTRV